MNEDETDKAQIPEEELDAEDGEELPDRETMMIVTPGPEGGLEPMPWPESEAPDDRYEQ